MRIKNHPVLITLTLMLMLVVSTLFVLNDTERTDPEDDDEDKTEMAAEDTSTPPASETGSYQGGIKPAASQSNTSPSHGDHLSNDHSESDYNNHAPYNDEDNAESIMAANEYEDKPHELFDNPQIPITDSTDIGSSKAPSSVENEQVTSHKDPKETVHEDVVPQVTEQDIVATVDTYPDETDAVATVDSYPDETDVVESPDEEIDSFEEVDPQTNEVESDTIQPEVTDSSSVPETGQEYVSDTTSSEMDNNGDMTTSADSIESADDQSDVEESTDYVELPVPDPDQIENQDTEPDVETPLDELDSEQIMYLLASSLISDSGTYTPIIDEEGYECRSVGSFGKERTNCFTVNTGASYNLWGGGRQFVLFNIEDLNAYDFLEFTICGENGTSGEMDISIYVDQEINDSPDYNFHMDSCSNPETAQINIKGASSLAILVNNLTGHENRMVFYDLAVF